MRDFDKLTVDIHIEGNPFIIRFKTFIIIHYSTNKVNIEGNPFIIRFKTKNRSIW